MKAKKKSEKERKRIKEYVGKERGRTTIDNTNRVSFSKRAMEGRLGVVKNKNGPYCPNCSHDKFFIKSHGIQCTRCRTWLKEYK